MMGETRAILITGAGSGIGRHLAVRLAGLGHTVYAAARRPSDIEALGALPGITPLSIDVRNAQEVKSAIEAIAARGSGLHGLVNNAGIGGIGPFTTWTEEEILEIFDVNVFGAIRVARACLTLLLPCRGRIVNIGSQGGSISMRYFGPYTMTKHALEAFTIALDEELAPHGVRVSIVQPGGIRSDIGEKAHASNLARFRRAAAPFDREAEPIVESLLAEADTEKEARARNEPESESNRKPSSPEIVATAVLDALFSPAPRRRYLVGTRWEGERVLRILIERLLDANECPSLGEPLERLVERLRAEAAERGG
jgi:NAD(P)-dependent dehydrogenase (short-subunit alcohol dehydrogenase family)